MAEWTKDETEIDLGYPVITAGQYIWQIDEVELAVNEETGSKGYRFTLMVDKPVDGDAKAVGLKGSWYVNVIKKDGGVNDMGQDQINKVINMTGGLKYFSEKFNDVDIDDEKLAAAFAMKLPGKFLRGTHIIETYDDKDGNEKNRMNFLKFQTVKGAAAAKKTKAATEPEPDGDDGEDW